MEKPGEHRDRSYAEVHETALRWAGALRRHAPAPTGVLAGRGFTGYVGILAALYAGSAAVPMNPAYPAARLRDMIRAAGVRAIVADPAGEALLPQLSEALGPDPAVVTPDSSGRALTEPCPVLPSDLAYILFTSGSTGRPKGVPISHGNADHFFRHVEDRYAFSQEDVFSQTFDLTFDLAMFDLFAAWGAGATVVPVPGMAYRDLPRFAGQHGLTVWFSTPSAIGLARRLGGLAPGSLPTLRSSLFCGEALRAEDAEHWLRAAPESFVDNLYGPTELTIACSVHRWTGPDRPELGVVPIGSLHTGLNRLVLDDTGAGASEGELCVTGPQLFAGYLDPADDANRFHYRDGRRWYRTGDRVRLGEQGGMHFLGRADDQVQLRGHRVEPGEIEHRIAGWDGVDQAVVVAPATQDGERALFVFYTGREHEPVAFARRLQPVLPQDLVPRHYRRLPEFPLNANRKLDRGELTRQAAAILWPSRRRDAPVTY